MRPTLRATTTISTTPGNTSATNQTKRSKASSICMESMLLEACLKAMIVKSIRLLKISFGPEPTPSTIVEGPLVGRSLHTVSWNTTRRTIKERILFLQIGQSPHQQDHVIATLYLM